MMPPAAGLWRPTNPLPLRSLSPAMRLGACLLAVVTAVAVPLPVVVPLLILELWLLHRAGLVWRRLPRVAGPWWPVALLVVAVHTVTTTSAAPLGHPSWRGAGAGLEALGRLVGMFAALGLVRRTTVLPELVAGLGWWLRPLGTVGLDTAHLGLVLAVALGTAPRTVEDARRVRAALRLRRGGGRPSSPWRSITRAVGDRAAVVPPLVAGLLRRADTLPLALEGRVPRPAAGEDRLPLRQGLLLAGWAVALVLLAVTGGRSA